VGYKSPRLSRSSSNSAWPLTCISSWALSVPLQYTASNPAWKDWAGVYALLPGFELRVFEDAGRLMVQGSGQPAAEAQVIDQDRIEVKAVGAVFVFERNARAEVTGLTLQQRGQSLPAKKRMP
jgi:serine-type D-Ala-D-Ala carboxypeptidase/endopeptidase